MNYWKVRVIQLEEMQKYTQGKIPPDKLPFDLTAELGEVVEAELRSPDVYYLALTDGQLHPEVYVVTKDAPAISEKARSYGQKFPSYPDLCVYDLHQPGSGRYVIDFEILRYRMKRHLPEIETEDSLQAAALYGAEEHPDYFGNFPIPFFTPRGYTVRHRTIMNGVYWLETDRCEEMLAVCYPTWQADITTPEQDLGEQLAYDRMRGINNTLGYLFFPKQGSPIPLYELSQLHPEVAESGVVNMTALLNAICEFYPEYSAIHNEGEPESQRSDLIKKTADTDTEFIHF